MARAASPTHAAPQVRPLPTSTSLEHTLGCAMRRFGHCPFAVETISFFHVPRPVKHS